MRRLRYACGSIAAVSAFLVLGCGKSMVPVTGTVTLDGQAVDGAMVVFTPDDTSDIASGLTDSSGNFKLQTGSVDGVKPGTYNVTVTRVNMIANAVSPAMVAASGGDPTKVDKNFEKSAKEAAKTSAAGPPGLNVGKAVTAAPKTNLPALYASPSTTPFKNIKVPPDGPVKLDLKSK